MKSIRKNSIILTAASAAALILEALPFGAVLRFANPEGDAMRKTYSYFSMMPFGYANVGPFITAILTCVLFILCVAAIAFPKKIILKETAGVALVAFTTSLLPLSFGISYYSVTALIISLMLLFVLIFSVVLQIRYFPKTKQI